MVEWLRSHGSSELAISVLVLGEIAKGVTMMEPGRRKDALAFWLEHDLPERFRGRLRPVIDGRMLATAVAHDLTLATRNVRDCGDRGVPVFDPWRGE